MMTQKCWLSRPPGAASLRLEGPVDALAGFQRHRRAIGRSYAALKPPQQRPRPAWKPSLAWGRCYAPDEL